MRTFCLLLILLLLPLASHAVNKAEVETLGKILALSKDIPAGNVEILAVYDENNPTSQADLENFRRLVVQSQRAPKHILSVRGVTSAEVAAMANAKVVMLMAGLSKAKLNQIRAALEGRKVLTATTSLSYVESGNCILGMAVGDTVKVVVHRQTLQQSGLAFDMVFQFMVNEI